MFSGSLVAIVTPMSDDGAVDAAAWERLLEMHLTAGTDGIVVGGTTGESSALSDTELRELVMSAQRYCQGRMQILAGAGTSSTASTVARARWLSELGVDGLLVVTPAYNKPTQLGLELHFRAVAGAASVPVILYNVPGRTAVDLLPETVAKLLDEPRIVAIKEAVADVARVRRLRALCGTDLGVLSGDDPTACSAVLNGAVGVVSVTSNVAPVQMAQMIAAAMRGDEAEAQLLDAPLRLLHERLFVESNPIPVKWALARMGMISGGLRLPLTPLSAHLQSTVEEALTRAGVGIGEA